MKRICVLVVILLAGLLFLAGCVGAPEPEGPVIPVDQIEYEVELVLPDLSPNYPVTIHEGEFVEPHTVVARGSHYFDNEETIKPSLYALARALGANSIILETESMIEDWEEIEYENGEQIRVHKGKRVFLARFELILEGDLHEKYVNMVEGK